MIAILTDLDGSCLIVIVIQMGLDPFVASAVEMPSPSAQTGPPLSLHVHRLDHSSSKLPSFRSADVKLSHPPADAQNAQATWPANSLVDGDQHSNINNLNNANNTNNTNYNPTPAAAAAVRPESPPDDLPSTSIVNEDSTGRPRTRSRSSAPLSPISPHSVFPPFSSTIVRQHRSRNNPVPASHSRNDVLGSGPPPAMITQKISLQALDTANSTKDWVANQSALTSPSATGESKTSSSPSAVSSQPTTPLIPPIRGFRTSRRSTELAASRRTSMDQDDTLKALEGFNSQRLAARDRDEQTEQNSDDSDLFLKLAREEAAGAARASRRVRAASPPYLIVLTSLQSSLMTRQSLPPTSSVFQTSIDRRRGSDLGSTLGSQSEHPLSSTYRPSARDKASTVFDGSRGRYYPSTTQSNPTTPRAFRGRETSPESQVSQGARRPSITDPALPSRAGSYRQSNLSYASPRTYNSSPLVSRTSDIQEGPEVLPRATDGTESTVSTTAASTVWDELEDLKSRIHRLELTGKLPATSGAAMSRASNDRPPTATTTVTTVSSSPKRVRNNSISPTESALPTAGDAHPLLSSALAKSKPLLSPEVYQTLEAAAADALAITSMMGTSGQPGPISSSQSTVGTPTGAVSDRQVRRKADSLCRSLTELCLALSEAQHEQFQAASKQTVRPRSRDTEVSTPVDNVQRPPLSNDLARIKLSPRGPSRLEARRTSLLIGSSLPSPRYAPSSEVTTPTQTSMAGRRSSLLLRSRRATTEEPEEDEGSRFRTPSRATTELSRVGNSPREYASQPAQPDNRLAPVQSSLPVRRHYVSTSLTNTSTPPLSAASGLGTRRFIDRSTPERDTSSMVGRMAEDRAQRKPSVGIPVARTSSITRRTRQSYAADSPTTGQAGGYQ